MSETPAGQMQERCQALNCAQESVGKLTWPDGRMSDVCSMHEEAGRQLINAASGKDGPHE
jgi:hypothetical protein